MLSHHRPYRKKVLCVQKRNGERIRAWEPRRETHFRRVAKAGARAERSTWLCDQCTRGSSSHPASWCRPVTDEIRGWQPRHYI